MGGRHQLRLNSPVRLNESREREARFCALVSELVIEKANEPS